MAFMDFNSFGSDNEVKSVLQKFKKIPRKCKAKVHINFQNMSLNNSVVFFDNLVQYKQYQFEI